ncbi:hypothetical protein CPB83DRAFT_863434 [Crepidotus variabilis]|uniref:Uncharacterized protein n=1 Tax=Crepidotus variabilis TaxID=179855 RepID=A0A9P6E656_9AGAR|nr:hypothetical protein CPB83DRAFT_863434 [Crepidotus variabilis]
MPMETNHGAELLQILGSHRETLTPLSSRPGSPMRPPISNRSSDRLNILEYSEQSGRRLSQIFGSSDSGLGARTPARYSPPIEPDQEKGGKLHELMAKPFKSRDAAWREILDKINMTLAYYPNQTEIQTQGVIKGLEDLRDRVNDIIYENSHSSVKRVFNMEAEKGDLQEVNDQYERALHMLKTLIAITSHDELRIFYDRLK